MSNLIDVNISFNSNFGTRGSGNGQFEYPSGCCVLNNELYIVDKQNHRIQVFNLSGVYQRQFGTYGAGNDNFSFPEGITTDGNNLIIADSANHRIKIHDSLGNYISQFGTRGLGDNNFQYPTGVYSHVDTIIIADKQNHRIKIHDNSGNYISQFGTYGNGNDNFSFPEDIEVINNLIYVADSGNSQVKIFNISGVYQSRITSTQFGNPTCITKMNNNVFTIVDKIQNKLWVFDIDLNLLSEYGTTGTSNDNFNFAQSISYDEQSQLSFTTDSANHRIKINNFIIETHTSIYSSVITKLSKQLYPTGRAWWLNKLGTFFGITEALSYSESRAIESSIGLLNSIIPDNESFTEKDAGNWERTLGLIFNSVLTLEERKAAILRKMQHPGTIRARQHYLYLQRELNNAGFNVYVNENRIDQGGGIYSSINPNTSIYGTFNYAELNYGQSALGGFDILGNYVDKSKESVIQYTAEKLRSTIFIGGQNIGDRANVSASREIEFRELILRIKPAQVWAFLFIDYI